MIPSLADRDPVMVRLAARIAARLSGSCSGVAAELEQLDETPPGYDPENNTSFCHELDRLVFCCTGCEWWFDQSENANPGYEGGEWMCRECANDE